MLGTAGGAAICGGIGRPTDMVQQFHIGRQGFEIRLAQRRSGVVDLAGSLPACRCRRCEAYCVPQDAMETSLLRGAQARIDKLPFWDSGSTIRQEALAELRQHRQRKLQPQAAPLPNADNVRITEREEYRKKCQVDRYAKMKNICGQYSMQAHHIVPDWTLRYGAREEADKRIPNMPSLNDGMAICVVGNAREAETEHWEGHLADKAIEDVGKNSTPLYTAPLSRVRN